MSLPNVAKIIAEDQTITIETVNTGVSVVVPTLDEIVIRTEASPGPVIKEIVTGPQGAPGLQNVYIQADDPSNVPGSEWGAAETGFIWIEVNV